MLILKLIEKTSTSELCSFFSLVIIGGILFTLSGYFRTIILAWKLKGPPVVPFLGNCLLVKKRDVLEKDFATAYRKFGDIARIWILFFPFFCVIHPEKIQVILSSKKHTDKSFFYKLLHNFLGNGLITSSGEKWHNHRRYIQPAFHLNILDKFIQTFIDASEAFYDKMTAVNKEINVTQFVNNCVLDILNESILGVPVKKVDGDVNMEESPFRQGKVVVPERLVQPWLLWDGFYQLTKLASDEIDQKSKLDKFTMEMITRRRQMKADGLLTDRKCLLDYMIEIAKRNPDFTDNDIVNEACTFMLAGQDSVGAAVAFCIFLLAQNQDCQKRCVDEMEEIFQGDNRSVTMQDLKEMRYLEMCIKETLRLYPSVPMLARKTGEETRLGKHIIPAGSNIFISPYATHRIPQIYPNPEKFDPERFTPENCEKRHPYAYIPFSAGPRYCIGNRFAILEMKTVISKILRTYDILPVKGKTTFTPIFRITVRASGGLWVRLQKRLDS
ncbi:hypothetical protein ACFFRR_008621 [Megaselia abdita]